MARRSHVHLLYMDEGYDDLPTMTSSHPLHCLQPPCDYVPAAPAASLLDGGRRTLANVQILLRDEEMLFRIRGPGARRRSLEDGPAPRACGMDGTTSCGSIPRVCLHSCDSRHPWSRASTSYIHLLPAAG